MPNTVSLKVQLVAKSEFFPPEDIPWETDADGGEALVEFSGRACYQSWSKPNPRTATNAGYLRHLLEVGHVSVLEHATVSFYITGISRSCTHELIRHRHFSYSQLSQRFVRENDANVVVPPAVEGDPELEALFLNATDESRRAYGELLTALEGKLQSVPGAPDAGQASQAGCALGAAQRHRDALGRDRELSGLAALRRDACHRTCGCRDPASRGRVPASAS